MAGNSSGAEMALSKGPLPFGRFERSLAARYLRAKRSEGGITLISTISFLGIMLAVAVLIVVMSVMNGFRAELLGRILGVNGHAYVDTHLISENEAQAIAQNLRHINGVVSVDPVLSGQAMILGRGEAAQGAQITGMDPKDLRALSFINKGVLDGSLTDFGKGEYGGDDIAIGARLATQLGVRAGDFVSLVAPNGAQTAFGSAPQIKEYRIGAVFSVGMSEYDQILVYMPRNQAQLFFGRENIVDVLEIRLTDPDMAESKMAAFQQAAPGLIITDWRQQSASLVGALKIERNVMRLILSLVIAIAALNIISGLVMLVKNKGRDIAVLRTMGAPSGSVMRVFMMIGAWIGIAGTFAGVVIALLFSYNIAAIQHFLEQIFGPLFNADVYFLSSIPAKVAWSEVGVIVLFSLLMSVLVTLPPALRAAKLDPVEALRYE